MQVRDEDGGVHILPENYVRDGGSDPGVDALLKIYRTACTGCDRPQEYMEIAGQTLAGMGIDAKAIFRGRSHDDC